MNTNDIHGAVRRAADDARTTCVLGYYPTGDVWDGRFHRINVIVNRPDLEVRHRNGYYAVASQKQATSQRAASLQSAVASPINANGLRKPRGCASSCETSGRARSAPSAPSASPGSRCRTSGADIT